MDAGVFIVEIRDAAGQDHHRLGRLEGDRGGGARRERWQQGQFADHRARARDVKRGGEAQRRVDANRRPTLHDQMQALGRAALVEEHLGWTETSPMGPDQDTAEIDTGEVVQHLHCQTEAAARGQGRTGAAASCGGGPVRTAGKWRYSRTWGGIADQSYVSVTVVRDGPVATRS
jgi:hypothetical protein